MKKRTWTQEEIDYIRENYGKISGQEIADHLGINRRLLVTEAQRHGIRSPRNRDWKSSDLRILRERFPTGDLSQLSKDLGRTLPAIKAKARQLGLRRKKEMDAETTKRFIELYPTTKNAVLAEMFGLSGPRYAVYMAKKLGVRKAPNYWKEIIRDDIARAMRASFADPEMRAARSKGWFKKGHKFGHRFVKGEKLSPEMIERRRQTRIATVEAERRRLRWGLEQKTKLRLRS